MVICWEGLKLIEVNTNINNNATLIGLVFTGVRSGWPDWQSSELDVFDYLTKILLFDYLHLFKTHFFIGGPFSESIWEWRRIIIAWLPILSIRVSKCPNRNSKWISIYRIGGTFNAPHRRSIAIRVKGHKAIIIFKVCNWLSASSKSNRESRCEMNSCICENTDFNGWQ